VARRHQSRRLTAALAAGSLGWVFVAIGVAAPAAHADVQPAHDPATYYAGTEGLTGAALAAELNSIIDGHTTLTYAEVYTALPYTDEDPDNPDNLIVFYSGTSLDKDARCGAGSCAGLWNREHSWPQSHGEIGTSGPGADLFHMRPEFSDTNSSRGNKDFDDGGSATVPSCAPCLATPTSFEPRDAIKGDLARGLFYMAVRYDGDPDDGFAGDLEMAATIPSSGPNLGKLSTLVAWSMADPPDDRERARNDLIDGSYQHNRNPFIDRPEWVCSIWGSEFDPGSACDTTGGNVAPTTSPVTGSAAEDTATTVTLTATDDDGDPLSYAVTTEPQHGTVTLDGSLATYTPVADYHGPDSFTFTASDATATSAPATATITVTPVNDPPSVSATTPLGATVGSPVAATFPTSDPDGDPVTISAVTGAAHGSVSFSGTTLTYAPTSGGSDTLGVTVSDGQGGAATTQVGVDVAKAAPGLRIAARGLEPGEPGMVKVKVRGVAGLAATGKVTVTMGSKKLTARVVNGVARFRVRELPDVTKLKVKARYSGDRRYAAASAKRSFSLT
jgi:endonuclease I